MEPNAKRKEELKEEYEMYYAVYENGEYVEAKTLNEIKKFPNFKWIFHQTFIEYYKTSYDKEYIAVKYECVDENGNKKIFEYGKIKGLAFSEQLEWRDHGPGFNKPVSCKLMDGKEKVREIIIREFKFNGFIKELINTSVELNECESWKNYDVMQENKILKERIKDIEKEQG